MKARKNVFWPGLAAMALASVLGMAWETGANRTPSTFSVNVKELVLPADGVSTRTVRVNARKLSVRIVEGDRRIRVSEMRSDDGQSIVTVRAGVLPGRAVLQLSANGSRPQNISVNLTPRDLDSFGDGTPDYLRLEGTDAEAFRQWFALLAEAVHALPAERRPAEIGDCAALLRFAYREALREHDGAWASGFAFKELPRAGSIEKYNYPLTPLGTGLFRVDGGSFAQFADARTLREQNAYFVSRDVRAARQGDLLFYRQANARMPDHAMIFLEKSPLLGKAGPWAVYHTGPSENDPGEIRRPTIADLLNHPEPQWRPTAANANFLGVYRWNILR